MPLNHESKAKVEILVLTYNQEEYIKETLDSLLNQKCSFKYKIVINDDKSTDRTPDILTEYAEKHPEIIDLKINDVNLGVVRNYFDALSRINSDYYCDCAGDDLWIDPNKLSKQVAFMDKNPDVSLLYTNYSMLKNGVFVPVKLAAKYSYDDLIINNYVPSLCTCIRVSLAKQYINSIHPLEHDWMMEDYPLTLWLSIHGSIVGLPDFTAAYRIHEGSITHSTDFYKKLAFQKNVNEIRLFFSQSIKASKVDVLEHNYYTLAMIAFCNGQYGLFKEYYKHVSASTFKKFVVKMATINKVIYRIIKSVYNRS